MTSSSQKVAKRSGLVVGQLPVRRSKRLLVCHGFHSFLMNPMLGVAAMVTLGHLHVHGVGADEFDELIDTMDLNELVPAAFLAQSGFFSDERSLT